MIQQITNKPINSNWNKQTRVMVYNNVLYPHKWIKMGLNTRNLLVAMLFGAEYYFPLIKKILLSHPSKQINEKGTDYIKWVWKIN